MRMTRANEEHICFVEVMFVAGVLIVFVLSLFICCAIAVMLGLFWFSDVRNRRYRSFFLLGGEVFAWTLLNAITMVCSEAYFPVIYTLRMVMVCIVPFGAAWFILDFIGSSLVDKRWMRTLLIVLPALDVLCMAGNPLHHLYFLDYTYPMPARAPLFWVHTAMDFLFIIFAFVLLIHFIVKGARRSPVLILTGVALLIPYSLNLLYSFGKIPFAHDTTPIGFFFTLLLFVYAAYKLQLFNIRTALFASTMDSLDDAIILFDQRLTLAEVNKKAVDTFAGFPLLAGRTRFAAFGEYLRDCLLDERPAGLLNGMKAGRDISGECTLSLRNETLRTYALTWHAVYQHKKLSGYILMLADVSGYKRMISEINMQNAELVELKEKAEEASRYKGEFLSRMSHEMRTPMNAIIGIAQVALRSRGLPQEHRTQIEKIQGASNHLLGVINDVLDMSKIEAGEFSLYEESFSTETLLRNISVLADVQAGQRRQQFEVGAGDLPAALCADSQRLTQVITNLLSNAFKFSPEGETVSFSIVQEKREGDVVWLRFAVRDNGIGISEEQLTRLFSPFVQADSSISRNYGGTGLGLAISKKIVELMGGRIWAESTPGIGSCFFFTMQAKIAEAADGGQEAVSGASIQPGGFAGCRILLAEDIEINREIILALLDDSGIKFDVAENGREAVDKYLSAPDCYDMILMDIQMPVMDGFEATKIIRSGGSPSAKTIPIVAMTANAFKEDIDACMEAGMNAHLAKPIDLGSVYRAIGQFYGKTPRGL